MTTQQANGPAFFDWLNFTTYNRASKNFSLLIWQLVTSANVSQLISCQTLGLFLYVKQPFVLFLSTSCCFSKKYVENTYIATKKEGKATLAVEEVLALDSQTLTLLEPF